MECSIGAVPTPERAARTVKIAEGCLQYLLISFRDHGDRAADRGGSDLDALLHGRDDLLDRLLNRHLVALVTIAVAERDGTGRDVVVAGQEHVRHLVLLSGPDLLLHPVRARVYVHPDPALAQPRGNVLQVLHVGIGDRYTDHLHRSPPGRERAADGTHP